MLRGVINDQNDRKCMIVVKTFLAQIFSGFENYWIEKFFLCELKLEIFEDFGTQKFLGLKLFWSSMNLVVGEGGANLFWILWTYWRI